MASQAPIPRPRPRPSGPGRRIFTGATWLALVLVCASVTGVVWTAFHLVFRDRQEALEQFEADRMKQVKEAARLLSEDLRGIESDLDVAGERARDVAGEAREQELASLLAFVDHYKLIHVYDASGKRVIAASSKSASRAVTKAFEPLMDETAQRALQRSPGNIEVTPFVEREGSGYFRVFAISVAATPEQPRSAIAILVDTRTLFEKLRLVNSADTSSRLLLMGYDGRPMPVSDHEVASAVVRSDRGEPGLERLGELVAAMRTGEADGRVKILPPETTELGLDDAPALAPYAVIRTPHGVRWTIATLNSMNHLRLRENSVARRLGFAASIVCLTVLGFGFYVVRATRRISDESLRQEREHSTALEAVLEQQQAVEAELQRAKEAAEAASRSKGEFLANVSHEVRSPMNGIVMATQLALGTELTREQRDYLSAIKGAAESLLTIINDILDFSKIEAGKLSLESVPFALDDVLADTIVSLAFSAHQKGLEIAYHVRSSVPHGLVGDAHRLRQIVVNLVGNAIKFTAKGEVILRVEAEPAALNARSRMLHFSVQDTGIGIPAEKQRLIFEPFSQADGSTTRKYGGTGLGLSICSRLVELMGGRLWVESDFGKGSTFHFTARFDRIDEAAMRASAPLSSSAPPPLPEPPPPVDGVHVLLVDDNATSRQILTDILEGWGAQVVCAENEPTALGAVRAAARAGDPFQLAIIDVVMPEIDGFALAERLRQLTSLGCPIVAMTTSVSPRVDRARCARLGVVDYVTKPIRTAHLRGVLTHALDGTASSISRPPSSRNGPVSRRRRTPLRILLAEDNVVNQKLAVRLLEKEGHQVTVVATGREALDAIGRDSFDLVLMDVQMPEMDGIEAITALRAEEARTGGHVPVIAMTAYTMKGDREHFLSSGFDGYVSKPIDVDELFASIERIAPGLSIPPGVIAGRTSSRPPAWPATPSPSSARSPSAPPPPMRPGQRPTVEVVVPTRPHRTPSHPSMKAVSDTSPIEAVAAATARKISRPSFAAVNPSSPSAPAAALGSAEARLQPSTDEIVAFAASDEGVSSAPDPKLAVIPPPARLPAIPQPSPSGSGSGASYASPPFDMSKALERVGGDDEILREIVGIFLEEHPKWLDEIGAAIAAGDAPALKRSAHTLKGAVDNVGASAAWDAARRLEKMGIEGKLEGADEAFAEVRAQIGRLAPALARFAAG